MIMKILFLGGCLLTTKTVGKDKRFVNVLQAENSEVTVTLARYASFSLVKEVFAAHTSEISDAVVFLIRPFPYYILTKLFPRVPGINGGTKIKIHPGLFSDKNRNWFIENDRKIVEMDWNPNGTKRTATHAINLKLGQMLGMEEWAINYVQRIVLDLVSDCRRKNIQLIVIGPPAVQNDKRERALLVNLNAALARVIPNYVDLFSEEFPDRMLGPDKVHYNDAGHFQLAKKIEERLFTFHASKVAL